MTLAFFPIEWYFIVSRDETPGNLTKRLVTALKITELYDLSHTAAGDYLAGFTYPWQALEGLKDFILALGPKLPKEEYEEREPNVWVHKTAKVFPSAYLGAPCIIGPDTEVRHCAFIRSSALVGAGCVVGNSVELKNVILFDGVQTPHYNYVGDSILGYKSHMGAGSITSNVKSDKTLVVIHDQAAPVETGRKKVGAFLGDHVEVGCNSVLNPGTASSRPTASASPAELSCPSSDKIGPGVGWGRFFYISLCIPWSWQQNFVGNGGILRSSSREHGKGIHL